MTPTWSLHELVLRCDVPTGGPMLQDKPATEGAGGVIAGGGFAGLALALALRQGLGPSFRIVVADPAFAADAKPDLRASAIAAAARRMFETLGVWDAVEKGAQPILDMVVTDSKLKDAMRPVFLTFAGEVEPGQPFAHMIENAPLNATLARKAREQGIELRATAITGFDEQGGRISVSLGDEAISASLLVAADGARSRVREQAGITTHG